MLKVFIGSSSEARKIVEKLCEQLSKHFVVKPWYDAFPEGLFTLERLLELVHEVDAAILVFAKDDVREYREEKQFMARDNILLEYGLFLGQLERKKMYLLKEKDVELPTDLHGLAYGAFQRSLESKTDRDFALEKTIEEAAANISKKWATSPSRQELLGDSIGLYKTISNDEETLRIVKQTVEEASSGRVTRDEPIRMGSTQACKEAYVGALDKVERRFWTTTFISSGFWTKGDAFLLEANKRMLARFKSTNGQARRIFLLARSADEEAQSYKERLIHHRLRGEDKELDRIKKEFHKLKESITDLHTGGFDIGFCETRRHTLPGRRESLDPEDSEIAIYDDFRVDIFGGGQLGRITDVSIYFQAMKSFDDVRASLQTYFDELWTSAKKPDEFLERMQNALESAEKRIDYETNWLARYEFALDREDEILKTIEIARVKEILRAKGRWGNIVRYLDIGTCTGRYPIGLRESVKHDGKAWGLDDDRDCINFAKAQKDKNAPEDARIQFVQGDFAQKDFPIKAQFDLITCMLGTLSHFGWNKKADRHDLLQEVIDRMKCLLTANGLLILGCWSRHACESGEMIRIYRTKDKERLASWTPSLTELKDRLDLAGLEVLEESQPEQRLDLLVCQHKVLAT